MEIGNGTVRAASHQGYRIVGLVFGVALCTLAGSTIYFWVATRSSVTHSALVLRASPISIRPHPQHCLVITDDDLQKIRNQVQPLDEGMSTSLYLHALRVFGLDSKYRRGKLASSEDTLRLFADDEFSKRILGTPVIVRTPYGVRCTPARNAGASESHRDYCLAVLSEQGLPVSFSIIVNGESFTLKDLVADSIANFHLGQQEIEWTALTYAMWLPPERRWVNKFGEVFSFDQLVVELMQRPLNKAVCAGSHVVQAMITLARVDREKFAILSPEVRSTLMNRLRAIVRVAEAAQASDGSWGPDWYEGLLAINIWGRNREHGQSTAVPLRSGYWQQATLPNG